MLPGSGSLLLTRAWLPRLRAATTLARLGVIVTRDPSPRPTDTPFLLLINPTLRTERYLFPGD